jgi:recombination protein RecA
MSQDRDNQRDPNRDRALTAALGTIEKNFGKGAIMRLGEMAQAQKEICVIPSGSVALDIALGVGGYPRGRIIEVFGPESSGKTTLTLHAIAETQRLGGVAAFIDAEHALDVSYARKLGVNVEDLLVSQPDHGEQALEIADTLVRSGGRRSHRHRLGGRARPRVPRSRARWVISSRVCRHAS